MARRSRKKPPDLEQVQRDMAEVMDIVRHYLVTPFREGREIDSQDLTRLSTSYNQSAQTYLKILQIVDMEARLEEIERMFNEAETERR